MKLLERPPAEGRILYQGRMHWIVYTGSLLWLVFGFLILHGGEANQTIGGIFFLLAIITGICTFFKVKTSYYIVGEESVVIQTGVLYRLSFDLPLEKIVDVKVKQGIIGKQFDFGTIIIIGADKTMDVFHRVAAPNELRRKIVERIPSPLNV